MILMTGFPLVHIKMNDGRRGAVLSYWNPTGDVSLINVPFAMGYCVSPCCEGLGIGITKLKGPEFLNAAVLLKFSMRYVQGRNYLFSS